MQREVTLRLAERSRQELLLPMAYCEEWGSLILCNQEEDICTPLIQLHETLTSHHGMAQPANEVPNYERERVVKLSCQV